MVVMACAYLALGFGPVTFNSVHLNLLSHTGVAESQPASTG